MGFRERMAQLKQRATDFGGDAVSKWKQAGERSRGGSDGNTGYFGTSPLQQAMHQQRQGNMTHQAMELMDRTMRNNPDEMNRQAQMMESGRHGGYGRGDSVRGELPFTPPSIDNKGSMSDALESNDVKKVDSKLLLDRYMSTDPSKMTSQGIKDMQQELNNNGYLDKDGNQLKIDGKVGPLTASAMSAYNDKKASYAENTVPERQSNPITQKKDLIRGWQSKDILGRNYRPDPQGDNPYERTVYNQGPENYVDYQEPSTGYMDLEDLTNPLNN